jgi:hypothetical protein
MTISSGNVMDRRRTERTLVKPGLSDKSHCYTGIHDSVIAVSRKLFWNKEFGSRRDNWCFNEFHIEMILLLFLWMARTIARFLDTRPATFEPSEDANCSNDDSNDDVIEWTEEWNEC